MKTLWYSPFILLIFLLACGEVEKVPSTPDTKTNDTPTEQKKETPPAPEVEDNRPPLYLSGLYASSTAPGSDVRNIFDRDSKSIWTSRTGTGPDEGIMLYLSEETFIKSIRIETAEGPGITPVGSYSIYVNGAPFAGLSPGKTAEIDQKLINIFLRFDANEGMEITERKIEHDFYDTLQIDRFASQQKIGVKQIVIEGERGEYKIVAPQLLAGEVQASSTLKAESYAYDPSLLFDARKEFVWVEGVSGNGEGETLNFNFMKEVTIAGLRIWNGYQRSQSHFDSNAKLRSFDFGLQGDSVKSYTLKKEMGDQLIRFAKPLTGKSFQLKINSVFKGWSYKDLAISEILFFDEADAFFGIKSPTAETIRNAILQKTEGTIIRQILDSRIQNFYWSTDAPMRLTRSVILRSDGTFVLYDSEEDEVDVYETIADGNWEIVEADAETATLKVFGKFLDFSLLEQYYAGKTDAELSRIFKDQITIKNNMIKGEKLVNAIEF